MMSGATTGVLGWSTRGNVAARYRRTEGKNADLATALVATDMARFASNADLNRYAIARGGAVFRANCSQCHGSGAAGAKGYPNLLDDDWLWGGEMADIAYTVRHGIRNEQTRRAVFADASLWRILEKDEITAVVEYVVSLV